MTKIPENLIIAFGQLYERGLVYHLIKNCHWKWYPASYLLKSFSCIKIVPLIVSK